MTKQDILSMLNSGETTLEEAEKKYDEILDSPEADQLYELLGFSKIEATAFMQGVPFEVLANWRSNGPPTICKKCSGHLDLANFGWLAKENKEKENEYNMFHVSCL